MEILVSALFVFVEFNGGSAKATAVMTLAVVLPFCCFFFFFLFAPLFLSPPALCRYLLARLRVVFVRATAVSYLLGVVFDRATGICSSSARMLFLQPFLSVFLHHVIQNTCRLFCVVYFFVCFTLMNCDCFRFGLLCHSL